MLILQLTADIGQNEWNLYCHIWDLSPDITLDMGLIKHTSDVIKLALVALESVERDLALAVLSEIASYPDIPESLLIAIFDTGSTGCQETISLRQDLTPFLFDKCRKANLIHSKI
ncbi:hypothetical protein [Enterobacter bugandensis]|uniref:hypothetical protein n=1 Tax=Enterobacter bugandensis TaxID=881260 RepID=UPI0025CAE2B9|nr:hypothetical protein [Enterobacter bugandensis]